MRVLCIWKFPVKVLDRLSLYEQDSIFNANGTIALHLSRRPTEPPSTTQLDTRWTVSEQGEQSTCQHCAGESRQKRSNTTTATMTTCRICNRAWEKRMPSLEIILTQLHKEERKNTTSKSSQWNSTKATGSDTSTQGSMSTSHRSGTATTRDRS